MALDSNRQPHIHIIGLGVAEKASLDTDATAVLAKADLIIAHPRQLATVAHLPRAEHCQSMALPKLSQLQDLLAPYADKTVVVLASGDPLYFGIGRWFRQHYALQQLCFYPAVSSLQAACHRLGLALQDVTVVSLHGRSVKTLARYLRQQRRLLILTDQHSQPRVLAQACYDAGFDQSVISVCENLGYQDERVRQFQLAQLLDHDYTFMPLHVSFIEVLGPGGVLPEAAGIDDAAFITGAEPGKGMISKREVRLASLAYMQPAASD
ncbi:MAG: precorrin-6y C5,15-methyltransferase (decarboxylating) subunit CbiE, partial [Pseudomonadales bacterium]|nr:precorrin-6y C5,15-methyltransferase (decarboxylating) subunit CbiE [Pseudomonadales bacterium]